MIFPHLGWAKNVYANRGLIWNAGVIAFGWVMYTRRTGLVINALKRALQENGGDRVYDQLTPFCQSSEHTTRFIRYKSWLTPVLFYYWPRPPPRPVQYGQNTKVDLLNGANQLAEKATLM